MSTTSLSSLKRHITGTLVAVAVLLGVAALPSAASARDYPASVERTFMRTCVASALKSSDGALTRAKARKLCRASLECIEEALTLKQFRQSDEAIREGRKDPHARTIARCTKAGLAAL